MLKQTTSALLALLLSFAIFACKVEKKEDGQMPKVDVEPGKLPKYDVKGPEVEVGTKEKTLTVPDVDVDVHKKEVKVDVPDIKVKTPK